MSEDVNLPEPQHLLTHKQTANKPAVAENNGYCYDTVDNICSSKLTSTFRHCCCYEVDASLFLHTGTATGAQGENLSEINVL